jgi:hypothetical protein
MIPPMSTESEARYVPVYRETGPGGLHTCGWCGEQVRTLSREAHDQRHEARLDAARD